MILDQEVPKRKKGKKIDADFEYYRGTHPYIAPEIRKKLYRERTLDYKKCDCYSYGIVLFEVMFDKEKSTMNKILQNKDYDFTFFDFTQPKMHLSENEGNQLKELVTKLLKDDPEERISMDDVIRDPWFQ